LLALGLSPLNINKPSNITSASNSLTVSSFTSAQTDERKASCDYFSNESKYRENNITTEKSTA